MSGGDRPVTGDFIAPDEDFGGAPRMRKEIDLDPNHGAVLRATMRVTALGVVEPFIEGLPVSEDVLTPGWSSYQWRLRMAEYDVTARVVHSGRSRLTLAASVGNGWYRGRLGWAERLPYGDELAVWMELRIEFEDSHLQVVTTNDSWRAGASETTSNSLYDGQHIDARRRDERWKLTGFDDSSWVGTHAVAFDVRALEPYVGPPVRRQELVEPVATWISPSGKLLVDFGQNLVGWLRVHVRGVEGQVVSFTHAEVLERGELALRPLRSAKATDVFTLSGEADTFEPTFTFHGFRYVQVEGWPGGLEGITPESLVAVVVHSQLERRGEFECSDPLLNRLHDNVVWGMRGNFLDVPTDCPQRDERLGWTGDIAVFAPTAAFLYDVSGFIQDWLRDLAIEQRHRGGAVPLVVPDVFASMDLPAELTRHEPTAVWGDAAVWVPWAMWMAYGDPAPLRDALPSMLEHGRFVRRLLSARGVWEEGFQFGDWLDPDAPPDRADQAKADPRVVATAAAFRTAQLISAAAEALDQPEIAEEFEQCAAGLREAFIRAFVSNERILSDCTTVYALAIVFDLLGDDDKRWASDRLAHLVVASGYRISTGFAGTPFILDALSSTGHLEEAYRLLLQRECPSWLYPVTMGATTIWERWDSMLPDRSVNTGEMTSFNHYALGAVADWMHRVVGGISPLAPGYSRLLIAPQPGGGLTWARCSLHTPRGLASVFWEEGERGLRLEITVPEGTTALVRLPDGSVREVPAGAHELTTSAPR